MRGLDLNDRLVAIATDGAAGVTTPVATHARDVRAQVAAQLQALATQPGTTADPATAGPSGTADASGTAERPGTAEPPGTPVPLWVAMSLPAQSELPGELLRQLREAGHAVQGFADRTALLAAWLDVGSELAVLEVSRRQFAIGLATRDTRAAALRRHVPLPGGEQALLDAWLRLAAATLVQQTRFDPLHDLRREADLRARLPTLVADAQRDGQATCKLDTGGGAAVTLALTRDQLAAAAQPVLAPLESALQALSAAHGQAVLLLPDSVAALPGIDAVLAGAHFTRIHRCGDDVAARAASLQPPSGAAADGGVPWRTRVPVLGTAAPSDVLQPLQLSARDPQTMATHLVFRGRVLPIPATGLVIGRDPGATPALQLPEGIAGLSRRHCTVRRDEAGRAQVIDHSSHGTFLDGARVRGRALLPAGAVLKLGDPGVELPLVAIEAG